MVFELLLSKSSITKITVDINIIVEGLTYRFYILLADTAMRCYIARFL